MSIRKNSHHSPLTETAVHRSTLTTSQSSPKQMSQPISPTCSTPNKSKPKPNSNPFFLATSNQTYGLSLVGLQEMAARQQEDTQRSTTTNSSSGKRHDLDLSFLYRRESDRIGEGIPNSDSALAAIMSTRMPKRHTIGHTSSRSGTLSTQSTQPGSSVDEEPSREEIEQALASYRHNPKQEDPLYTTTANEIGRKAPSYATYTVATKGRSQAFSNSFNGVMYTDESLAT